MMEIEFIPARRQMEKSAATKSEVQALMDKVYKENPSYWPYGITAFDGSSDMFLVRDKMTKQACGFVGWQEFEDKGQRVGSYFIGILPEYRGNGFAKEAVAKIIQKKAAQVDRVQAFIMPHNTPSKKLAETLHIPVKHKF